MNKIQELYADLKKKHGHPQGQWLLWCKRPKTLREKEWVIIESILTQITNWRNVQLAMDNLKRARSDSLQKIAKLNKAKLSQLIKPAGFYKQKSDYLLRLAKFVLQKGGVKKLEKMPLDKLREELLFLKGIGRETADSILLYALEKPIFTVDEYTRRLLEREKITNETDYEKLREIFEANIRCDWRLYQDFHALIVIHSKSQL